MDQHNKKLLFTCGGFAAIVLVFIFVVGLIGLFFIDKISDRLPGMNSEDTSEVIMTPSQIESIRRIGQWEFMSINDEELVDTIRKGFFSDDHLVRIYYGTLRLGIDLSDFDAQRISKHRWQYSCPPSPCWMIISLTTPARTRSMNRALGQTKTDRHSMSEPAIR